MIRIRAEFSRHRVHTYSGPDDPALSDPLNWRATASSGNLLLLECGEEFLGEDEMLGAVRAFTEIVSGAMPVSPVDAYWRIVMDRPEMLPTTRGGLVATGRHEKVVLYSAARQGKVYDPIELMPKRGVYLRTTTVLGDEGEEIEVLAAESLPPGTEIEVFDDWGEPISTSVVT